MKNCSKAAKRRAKKSRKGVRSMFDRWQTDAIPVQAVERDDPQATVLAARARQMGRKQSRDLLDAKLCDEAGRAIDIGAKDGLEAADLWQTFKGYDGALDTYSRRVLCQTRFAKSSKIEFMPEPFEARSDDNIDLRTDDEKIAAARDSMARWWTLLSGLKPYEKRSIHRAARHEDALQEGGELTTRGKVFVHAMRSLHAAACEKG